MFWYRQVVRRSVYISTSCNLILTPDFSASSFATALELSRCNANGIRGIRAWGGRTDPSELRREGVVTWHFSACHRPRPRPRINPRMIDAFDAPNNGGVGAELPRPLPLIRRGLSIFTGSPCYVMFMFSLVSISRHFFKGAIARNGAIVIVLVFLIAKRIVVTAEMLLPSFLGNDGSPFLDSGFHKVMYCSQLNRPTLQ